MSQANFGGPIIITSHKFTPPGYPWDIIVVVAHPPSTTPSQGPGSGAVVISEDTPPETETPPAPAGHTLITGALIHSGYAEGNFLVEARPSTPCDDAVCADMSALPLASVKVVKPGYFALVMPRSESEVFVVATYSHPTDGTSTREQHLGPVSDRVNGITLDFSPEESAEESSEGDGTLSPEDAKALQDLFDQAEAAQEDMNEQIRDALSGLF
jgi:hypothetical protein